MVQVKKGWIGGEGMEWNRLRLGEWKEKGWNGAG